MARGGRHELQFCKLANHHVRHHLTNSQRMNSDKTCTGWTKEQNKAFENALAMYSGDYDDQWERIAAEFAGKTIEEVQHHFKLLVEDVDAIESGSIPLPCYKDDANNSSDVSLCERGSQAKIQTGSSKGRMLQKLEQERRRGIAWTEEEHRLFLQGLETYGRGDWKSISRYFVRSRTPTQVASHAQKYFIRLKATNKERRRSSIYDIITFDDGATSAPQGQNRGQINGNAEARSSNEAGKSTPLASAIHIDDGY